MYQSQFKRQRISEYAAPPSRVEDIIAQLRTNIRASEVKDQDRKHPRGVLSSDLFGRNLWISAKTSGIKMYDSVIKSGPLQTG